MSVVIGIKNNGKVYIGADSQLTCGGTKSTATNPNNFKVWKVDGTEHCLMAYVGRTRDSQYIRAIPPELEELAVLKDEIDFKYVVTTIVPHIFSVLETTKCKKAEDQEIESEYLFAYKDRLYHIMMDGTVIEVDDYIAIGSGGVEALASLRMTETLKPETRILQALSATSSIDNYVAHPYVISDTGKCNFKIYMEG